jgi:tetratricopeptide (TPR) repeat protein
MAMPWFDSLHTPASDDGLLMQAGSLMQMGRFREALLYVEQVLAFDAENFQAWLLKGEILRQDRSPQEAVEAFLRALEIDPYDDWIMSRLSEAYRDMGRPEEALPYLDRALELNPESVFALAVKGEILRSRGDLNEAIALLDRSLDLNLTRAHSFAARAEALRQDQHHEESLFCYDNALTASTHSAWVLASKGEALRSLGELEAALETIDHALQLRQRHLALLGTKAETLRKVGRYEDALACFDRAQEIHSEKARMFASKAMVLADLGQLGLAGELLLQAVELSPQDPFLWWLRGDLLDRQGQHEQAEMCLARVVELNPVHAEAVAALARLRCCLGEFDQARDLVRHYLSLRDDDWGYFLGAIIELKSGRKRAAHVLLKQAIRDVESRLRQDGGADTQIRLAFNLALYCVVADQEERALSLYEATCTHANSEQLREALQDLRFVSDCGVTVDVDPLVSQLRHALGQ